MQKPPDSVMTIDDLALYLKVAKSTLYKLAQEGKLPAQKVGRHWRFHKEAVDAWLKQQPEPRSKPKRKLAQQSDHKEAK